MVYVDKVHYAADSSGNGLCIEKMKWTNDLNSEAVKECTKQEMINFINKNPNCTKTKFYSNWNWIVGEDVRVIDNSYLRTDSNGIKADNLGCLPRY